MSSAKTPSTDANDRRRFIISLVVILTWTVAVIAWIVICFLGPEYAKDGTTIVNDRPQNIASLLGVVTAASSLVVGFWFGAAGKSTAEKAAAEANADAAESRAAIAAKSANPSLTEDELRGQFPRAFGVRS